jgi:hypothetical protein
MAAALGIGVLNVICVTTSGQMLLNEQIDIYLLALGIMVSILILPAIFAPKLYQRIPQWVSWVVTALIALLAGIVGKKNATPDNTDLYETIKTAGYSYDSNQDIFYSNMDAWQRNMGYCRLYDEAAAPMGMIIDCEPIYFEYDGKRWLIEFWKGQYDLTTGCELGVYTTKEPDLDIPGVFSGPFFRCAEDGDCLEMDYYLMKNDKNLFTRKDRHWWLTGFILGEFSEPAELTMHLTIHLKDEDMRDAFVGGLKNAGYSEDEISIRENAVSIKFDKVHTEQPITRVEETDRIIQLKNLILCEQYQEITGPYKTFPEKVKAIQEKSTELYNSVLNMGRTKQLFESFNKIKDYID